MRRCMQMFIHRSEGQPWSCKRHYQDGTKCLCFFFLLALFLLLYFFTLFFFFICSSFSQRPRRDAALPLLAVRRHPSHSPDQERPLQEPQHQRAALVPLHTLAAEVQTLSLVKKKNQRAEFRSHQIKCCSRKHFFLLGATSPSHHGCQSCVSYWRSDNTSKPHSSLLPSESRDCNHTQPGLPRTRRLVWCDSSRRSAEAGNTCLIIATCSCSCRS